jgi:hypothetical protein
LDSLWPDCGECSRGAQGHRGGHDHSGLHPFHGDAQLDRICRRQPALPSWLLLLVLLVLLVLVLVLLLLLLLLL